MGTAATRRPSRRPAERNAPSRGPGAVRGVRHGRADAAPADGPGRGGTAGQGSRLRFLEAALHLIRAQGYAATTIDDVCREAGLTKGSFFHHFRGKQDLALAAAAHFSDMADTLFAAAPFRAAADPVERLLGYVDFRKAILQGDLPRFTCLLGTLVQEAYVSDPAIRAACESGIDRHAASLEADIAAAIDAGGAAPAWSASSLALFTQAVIQGSFVLAKAKGGPRVAAESLDHLHRYIALLFARNPRDEEA